MKFDKAYVISLEESRERRDTFFRYCRRAALEVDWFPGLSGRDLDQDELIASGVLSHGIGQAHWGSLGCMLSHIEVWRHFAKQDMDVALVFEDDAIIPRTFSRDLETLDSTPLGDWDMIMLGCFKLNCTPLNRDFGRPNSGGGNTGQYGYLIHRRAIAQLESFLLPFRCVGHDIVLRENFANFNPYFLNRRIVKNHRFRFPSVRREINRNKIFSGYSRWEKVVRWMRG